MSTYGTPSFLIFYGLISSELNFFKILIDEQNFILPKNLVFLAFKKLR